MVNSANHLDQPLSAWPVDVSTVRTSVDRDDDVGGDEGLNIE